MLNRHAAPCLLALAVSTSALAGDLNPPAGPVAPAMKTLDEVEPRTAINAANTPGDANSVFKITAIGSYYLTGNIFGADGKVGIEIAASFVTIDLMGYVVSGLVIPPARSLDGIQVTQSGATNIVIRNGFVSSWGGDGVDVSLARGTRLAELRVFGNLNDGIRAGEAAVVTACSALSNGNDGICAASASTIAACSASSNAGDGVQVGVDCLVRGNTCDGNGAGIRAANSDNRIEDNLVINNDRGIDVDADGNLIVRNFASGNTNDYDIIAGNDVGTIRLSPIGADPWDNFIF